MALSSREKNVVSFSMLVLVVAGGWFLLTPAWDGLTAKNTQVDTLEKDIESNQQLIETYEKTIARLKKENPIPDDRIIREFTPETQAKVTKEMVDKLVKLSTSLGNDFLSLKPYDASLPVPAAPEPDPAAAATPPATDPAAAATDPAAVAAATPPPPNPMDLLAAFGYELTFRGNYESIMNFLASLNTNKELVEVTSISLENEDGRAGAAGTPGAEANQLDPFKPIRLTTKIRIYLQKQH